MDITQANALTLDRTTLETLRLSISEQKRAKLYLALEKWFFGEESMDKGNEFAFQTLTSKISQAVERYNRCVANGSKGGRPRRNQEQNQDETKNITKDFRERNEENKEKESFPPHPLYKEKEKKEEKRESTPLPLKGDTSTKVEGLDHDFELFWNAYAKKVGKPTAYRAFVKAEKSADWPGISALLEAVHKWNATYDWLKDNGQYKPYPATWLNRKGWVDELPSEAQPAQDEPPKARGMLKLILEQP